MSGWTCGTCTFINEELELTECSMCLAPRALVESIPSSPPQAMLMSLCSEDAGESTTDELSDDEVDPTCSLPHCPVCRNTLNAPVRAPCGHSFCAGTTCTMSAAA